MSSTTFDNQLEVASAVAQESPELYYEIQSLNDYGSESLEALAQAIEKLRSAVLSQDFESFATLMRRGREYLEDRRAVTERRA
jgi:chorismate mutase/prephenate dehydrogenase